MLKKIISIIFIAIIFFSPTINSAQSSVPVYFFWGDGCPHCVAAKPFLQELERQNPSVKVYSFEVWYSTANRKLLTDTAKELKIDVKGVPFIVVGQEYVTGFYNAETTGRQIQTYVERCMAAGCVDIVGPLAGLTSVKPLAPEPPIGSADTKPQPVEPVDTFIEINPQPEESELSIKTEDQSNIAIEEDLSPIPESLRLPLVGEIKTKHLSLPLLTIIIAALDGFNPCAMWVLVFLIGLLLGVTDVKRRWLLGSTFIVASAAVYFVFLAAWLNLILFIGAILIIRIIIGLVAIGGGAYSLREYFLKRDETCKVTAPDKRRRVFDRLKAISQEKRLWLALGGIILLAFAVNLVELICSAGLPAVYTQILALSPMPHWQYYLYLLLYIFIFMLDDMIVFAVAMVTLQITGLTTKYTRWAHLIGGILMVIVGLLLIFKPQWLMFG